MAISTYAELKTAIGNWLDEDALTDRIVEFITLAEGRINRKLRGLQQETLTTANYDPDDASQFLAFPTGFREMIDIRIKKQSEDDDEYKPLRFIPPERIWTKYTSTSGEPNWYTIRSQIELNRLPDVVYTVQYHYLKGLDVATDSTNWLLTNYPDVYLYGALSQAEPYLMNDNRIALWKSLFEEGLEEVNDLDERSRDDGEMSVSEVSNMTYRYSNYDITSDDY